MKYGCCVNILPKSGPKTGIEYVQKLKDIGYDYVELPLNDCTKLSNDVLTRFFWRCRESAFPVCAVMILCLRALELWARS